MSTSLAISSVTNQLLQVLGTDVASAKSPDNADKDKSPLNVFLYHVSLSPTWRNQDLPALTKGGQPARPLLPVVLHYVISACEDSQVDAHTRLGKAMLAFHDMPLLSFGPNSGIKNQTDPIRVTFQPMNIDEMYKLWSAFQTAYRPSVAYEVGVVLIESDIADPSPLPVTRRGPSGTGWDASTQFPAVLNAVRFKTANQPGMRLGETVTLVGQNLNQPGQTRVAFRHPLLDTPLLLTPNGQIGNEITVTIPDLPDGWPAGIYLASVQNTVGSGDSAHSYTSNAFPIALLPEIIVADGSHLTATNAAGRFSLELPCKPTLRTGQRIQLLVGSLAIDASSDWDLTSLSNPIAKWKESGTTLPSGERRFARLRVDGVDSLVYDPAKLEQGFDTRFEVQGLT